VYGALTGALPRAVTGTMPESETRPVTRAKRGAVCESASEAVSEAVFGAVYGALFERVNAEPAQLTDPRNARRTANELWLLVNRPTWRATDSFPFAIE
jgi:hypothetical protein